MKFLVSITLDAAGVPDGRREALFAAERAVAERVRDEGTLVAMWRVRGEPRTVSIWEASDERALDALLDRLPLRSWMQVDSVPLDAHYLFESEDHP